MTQPRQPRAPRPPQSPKKRLDQVGEEPDARFSFANERTYLAWNRTALAVIVAGLAVTNILIPDDPGAGPKVIGVTFMVLGVLLAGASYFNWYAAEKALRERRPLPHSPLLLILSIITGVVAVIAAIYTLT